MFLQLFAATITKNSPVLRALELPETEITLSEIADSPDNDLLENDAPDILKLYAGIANGNVLILKTLIAKSMTADAQILFYLDLDNDPKSGRQNVLAGTDVILLIKTDTNSVVYFNNAFRNKISLRSFCMGQQVFLAVKYPFIEKNRKLVIDLKAVISEKKGGKGDRINDINASLPLPGGQANMPAKPAKKKNATTGPDMDRDGIGDAVEQAVGTPLDYEQELISLQAQSEQDAGIIEKISACHVGGYRLLLKISCSQEIPFPSGAQVLIYLDIDNDSGTGRKGSLDGCDSLAVINKDEIKFLYWNSAFQNKLSGAYFAENKDLFITLDCPWPVEKGLLSLKIMMVKIEKFHEKNPAWLGLEAQLPVAANSSLAALGGAPKEVQKIKELDARWQNISAPSDETKDADVLTQSKESDWKVFSSGDGDLSILIKNGVLFAQWSGGEGEAVLECIQSVPPKVNAKKQLRYICELNILESEYGGQVFPKLMLLNEKGNPVSTEFDKKPMYASGSLSWTTDPQYHEEPGSWGVIDFQKTITSQVTGVRPCFVLKGNRITVAIGRMRVEAVPDNLGFARPNIETEKRDFSQKESDDILAKRAKAVPKLIKKTDRVTLLVNGQEIFPAIYHRGTFYPRWTRYGDFSQAGFNVFYLPILFGNPSETHKTAVGPLWLGKNKFNFSRLEEELRIIAAIEPDALVILSANVFPYPQWAEENPDAVLENAKGEKGVNSGGEGIAWGIKPDYTCNRENYFAPSLYSEEFRRDCEAACTELGKFLETSPAGKIVFQVDFCGGDDGQFYPWDRDDSYGEDHCPAALKSWRDFLTQKYTNNTLLQATWNNDSASLDKPGIPSLTERSYTYLEGANRRGCDYNDFTSHRLAELLIAMGRGLKAGSSGRLLAGAYYPDAAGGRTVGKHSLGLLCASPHFDSVRTCPGWEVFNGSLLEHGKLHLQELDIRNAFLESMLGSAFNNRGMRFTTNFFRAFAWRYAAQGAIAQGGGYYHYDMAEGWYCEPDSVNIFGEIRKMGEHITDNIPIGFQVGFFLDEKTMQGLPYPGGFRLMGPTGRNTYDACSHSGLLYRIFLEDEVYKDSFQLPKICIFPLPLEMTPQKADKIRTKAKIQKAIVIWGFGPGRMTSFADKSEHIIPFRVKPAPETAGKLLQTHRDHPLLKGWEDKLLGSYVGRLDGLGLIYPWPYGGYSVQPETGVTVLARYAGTQIDGLAVSEKNGLIEIFNGAPGGFSPQFFRNLAALAGCQPLSDDDSLEIYCGSGLLSVYADTGGVKQIYLPKGVEVRVSLTGHKFKNNEQGFKFKIGYADTAVFSLKK